MEREQITDDQAFQILVRASQRLNIKLTVVAGRLTEAKAWATPRANPTPAPGPAHGLSDRRRDDRVGIAGGSETDDDRTVDDAPLADMGRSTAVSGGKAFEAARLIRTRKRAE